MKYKALETVTLKSWNNALIFQTVLSYLSVIFQMHQSHLWMKGTWLQFQRHCLL